MKIITYTRINKCEKYIERTTVSIAAGHRPWVIRPLDSLLREQGPKRNKTSSIVSQRQCLIDLHSTHALGKFITENVAIAFCAERICWTSKIVMFALFFFFTWPKGGERESCRKKNKLNHILRLLSSRIIFVSLNTNPSFSRHKTVPNSQSQEINYSQTIKGKLCKIFWK